MFFRKIAHSVKDLHHLFIDESIRSGRSGKSIGKYSRNTDQITAYRDYYLIVNMVKIAHILKTHQYRDSRPINVLDIATGPGTASLGLLKHVHENLPDIRVDVTGLDRSPEFLKEAGELIESCRNRFGTPGSTQMIPVDLNRKFPSLKKEYSMILISNLAGELKEQMYRRIVHHAVTACLAPDGLLLLLEPGSCLISRRLLQVRDQMAAHNLKLRAPCPTSHPCPALKTPDDWCHHRLAWQPPEMIGLIDRLTGLNKRSLNFTYALLHKEYSGPGDTPGISGEACWWRVVSDPKSTKVRWEVFLCSGREKRKVLLLKKNMGPGNSIFKKLKRYDRVVIDGWNDDGECLLLGGNSLMKRLQSDIRAGNV